jgi:hypothetical protein
MFSSNQRLQDCAVSDPAHVTPGSQGLHVFLIQQALRLLTSAEIAPSELDSFTYGPSTAEEVLAYKQQRGIINFAYQTTADNIVGKMTIERLDREMLAFEMGLLRLGGAGFLFRGISLLAAGKVATAGPQVVIVSEGQVQFSTWARQVVKFFTEAKKPIANLSIEAPTSPSQIATVYETAAILAGAGGIIIINAGHGFPPGAGTADDGRFDLAPHKRFMVGGRNNILVGEPAPPNPTEKIVRMHTSAFYDEEPGLPRRSKKHDDETINQKQPAAKERLANWNAYESVCKSFKARRLHGVVLLTCRVGQSSGLLKKVSTQWGCPIIGYRRRVVGELTRNFKGKRLVSLRSRLFLEGDAPNSGTNIPLGEVWIPMASDMVLIS